MAGLGRSRPRQFIPAPGGENAQEAVSIYQGTYGELPMPATAYVLSSTPLRSLDDTPSVLTARYNAAVVDRSNDKQGMVSVGGRQNYQETTPQINNPVPSSKFQDWLMGPQVNYSMNNKWYIVYPAATLMNGGKHNLAWSERVPQLPTRVTGGPGASSMNPAPRFKSVQVVPRYSTMPSTFDTASTNT